MNNKKIKLIDGIFEPTEAIKVLSGVINSKINFHKLEDFSNHIRFDGSLSNSKKRIDELNQSLQDFIALIAIAKNKNLKISIKSDIIIELVK